ncbi:glutaredoxin family protein [uncultured Pseudacidovorax sp.]|uniref:glutaredoxin family protein n=1 Tax=uncultured Pseudacidovorax sp. TaxID=679313 RepID=UPI0025F17348|nr:glutaredoxin family protein [uncultured Pseudacidovorax sp.]
MKAAPGSRVAALLLATGLAAAALSQPQSATAQPLYRSVDGQGRVTFSDRPPSSAARPVDATPANDIDTGAGALPFELRQVVQRYPVTLYAQRDCAPCDEGRAMLRARGIPFQERTVTTNAEVDALQRLSGQTGLPLLVIGSQQLRGYTDAEWSQYLNAAGYPSRNSLPAGYTPPAARPLIAPAPAAAVPQPPQSPAAAPPPSGPTPANPAGIRF